MFFRPCRGENVLDGFCGTVDVFEEDASVDTVYSENDLFFRQIEAAAHDVVQCEILAELLPVRVLVFHKELFEPLFKTHPVTLHFLPIKTPLKGFRKGLKPFITHA